jgi:glycerol-3-phosphate acyltransferase PlsY
MKIVFIARAWTAPWMGWALLESFGTILTDAPRALVRKRAKERAMLASLAFVAAAYLIGSISFAVVTSRLFGLPDPHSYGSGNPGATNVLRTGNRAAAVLTLLGDGIKGWVAVSLAQHLGPQYGVAEWTVPAVALAVFVGHLYPVFHRFRGGKGVATAAGIVAALAWPLAIALFLVWFVLVMWSRISSVAALVTAALLPVGMFFLAGNTLIAWVTILIAVLLVWRHRSNIRGLLAGNERVFSRRQ